MSAITNEWKTVRLEIGNLVCLIDSLYNQADDIDMNMR